MEFLPWLAAIAAWAACAVVCLRCRASFLAAKKALPPSIAAAEILHDLTRGSALVRIERINPVDVLLRSPRA